MTEQDVETARIARLYHEVQTLGSKIGRSNPGNVNRRFIRELQEKLRSYDSLPLGIRRRLRIPRRELERKINYWTDPFRAYD